jgi:hypothetical protein
MESSEGRASRCTRGPGQGGARGDTGAGDAGAAARFEPVETAGGLHPSPPTHRAALSPETLRGQVVASAQSLTGVAQLSQ